MKISATATGSALLLAASFIWGTALVAQSIGTDYIGPFTFMAVRFAVATLSLLPVQYLMSRKNKGAKSRRESGSPVFGALGCGVLLFTFAAFQQAGIAYTTVGKSGFITTLYVVFVPLLGVFLGRKFSPVIWLCVATALAGMYMLCIDEELILSKGDAYMLGGAFFVAVHIFFIDHFSKALDALRLSCLQFMVCAILSFFAALIFEKPALQAIQGAAGPLLYTGVLSGSIAYTFQVLGQARVNPMIASLILSLESVFAALAGWLALGEVLSSKELLGCVLIFAAVMLAQLADYILKK